MVVTKYSAQDTGLVRGTVSAVVIDDSSVAWEDRWAGWLGLPTSTITVN